MPTYVVLYKTFTRDSHLSFSREFTQFLKTREHLAILFSRKGRETIKVYLKSPVTVLESWGYGFWCYCSDVCSLQREKKLGVCHCVYSRVSRRNKKKYLESSLQATNEKRDRLDNPSH